MKISIESTSKIVELVIDGHPVPARVWQGYTIQGIPVHCFITRISPEVPPDDPDIEQKTALFGRDLQRCADPRPAVEGIPLRMFID